MDCLDWLHSFQHLIKLVENEEWNEENQTENTSSGVNKPTAGVTHWIFFFNNGYDEARIGSQIQRFLDVTAAFHHK